MSLAQNEQKNVQRKMLWTLAALLPPAGAGIWQFGWRAAVMMVLCIAVSMAAEGVCCLLLKRPQSVLDGSAAVTGLILSLMLPVTLPLWEAALGAVTAIVFVKQLCGGFGKNPANPANTARLCLWLVFMKDMTHFILPRSILGSDFGYDAISAATPMAAPYVTLTELFLGQHGGCIGETCAAAVIVGGMFLIFLGYSSPATVFGYLGSFAVCVLAAGGFAMETAVNDVGFALLSGGLLFGAFYVATDPVTSPKTIPGRLLYGIGCGGLTFLLRQIGEGGDGISIAVLVMNLVTLLLDRLFRPRTAKLAAD